MNNVNSLTTRLLKDCAKDAFLIDNVGYMKLTQELSGICYYWNPAWRQSEFDEHNNKWLHMQANNKWLHMQAKRYENEDVERVVYIISGGNVQPHSSIPKYSLVEFHSFLKMMWERYPHIREQIKRKMEVYIALSFPSHLTLALGNKYGEKESIAIISVNTSPVAQVKWPRITFATTELSIVDAFRSFFKEAISQRYGKRINIEKFLDTYQKEQNWQISMESSATMVLIVNNAESDDPKFVEPIERFLTYLNDKKCYHLVHKTVNYCDLSEELVNRYDAIILSASPYGDDIVEHHLRFYKWLDTTNIPTFGICAGHQILGCFFKGDLLRREEIEEGYTTVYITEDDPIFRGEQIPPTMQHHQDSIKCPPDFDILAKSNKCNNQIMKHRQRPIYSTQFHSEKNNRWMLESFISLAEDFKYKINGPSLI